MKAKIPEFCLVLLVGPSGSGKSTFAHQHFKPTEVLSSDYYRGLVSDDANDQNATKDAFDVLHYILRKRLANRKLCVVDATNVRPEDRKSLVQIAREHDALCAAIVLNLPEKTCQQRNEQRPDRNFGKHVIRQQSRGIRRSLRGLSREGFRFVHILSTEEEVDEFTWERQKLWVDKSDHHGPFDIIGDIHGCCDELERLLTQLGYTHTTATGWSHAEGRKVVFLGDLVDRGPRIVDTLRLVIQMVDQNHAICVPGNHDLKLLKHLNGKDVKLSHGLDKTVEELDQAPPEFKDIVREFLSNLVSHFVLDRGKLVVAHAGMPETYQGRASGRVRQFALYGETTGETDEYGLPVRLDWAREYRGQAMVVYGHTPVPEPEWINHTINIDTGCVYGGRLTALRYPEKELFSEAAKSVYAKSSRPNLNAAITPPSGQAACDGILDLSDVAGKRIIGTRYGQSVTIREENSAATLEVVSRFSVNPKWLIYLPPTMSPPKASSRNDFLEYPDEAFQYFQEQRIDRVICQEKHMGSRAILVVCRDLSTARSRFGIEDEGIGKIYTRTGRAFFNDCEMESQLLELTRDALDQAGIFTELNSDWVCLDCELMPWSLKAQELLKSQYSAVGAASGAALQSAVDHLATTRERGIQGITELHDQYLKRQESSPKFIKAYQSYCWDVSRLEDLRLAPFHILASDNAVHADKEHAWHMHWIGKLVEASDAVLFRTTSNLIDLTDPQQIQKGIDWWTHHTGQGGEGMVVKPPNFMVRSARGWIQPGLKCRGREYLRIIYGPEYLLPENLERLRSRGLSTKRSMALRESILGLEGLERFVEGAPLRRVHECVFGVLALETEPVDARL